MLPPGPQALSLRLIPHTLKASIRGNSQRSAITQILIPTLNVSSPPSIARQLSHHIPISLRAIKIQHRTNGRSNGLMPRDRRRLAVNTTCGGETHGYPKANCKTHRNCCRSLRTKPECSMDANEADRWLLCSSRKELLEGDS